ncbi:anthranilate synthase component II [Echinimonas agarilytica]|uniref:Aminodeoxychorismate/anthranilate synthase component II n=1 Tax=Echinimonas agarilytica TaxID=1215918 RepID=A0AA41W3Y5_9GAMM|nr:aminodeoxychorismate/anthranilate synthase component II [Echinimonas agarilytica]MCM2678376.1 aminodeoxychorismate/anthranilate synthase component II [Echinimonas agarilytica]
MLLMIDNYDSFTYNLVQYFQQLGEEVVVRRNDEVSIAEVEHLNPDYLVISPGPCSPDEAGESLALVRHFAGQLPILGVCLGHQTIGQVFGAKVVRAHRVMHGKTSLIDHQASGLFAELANPLQVTRYHSLLLAPDSLPDCFKVTATCVQPETGEQEIMAIEHLELPLWGVQFHPESILTESGHALLNNFLTQKLG